MNEFTKMDISSRGAPVDAIFVTWPWHPPTSLQDTLASSMQELIFEVIKMNGSATHYSVFFSLSFLL